MMKSWRPDGWMYAFREVMAVGIEIEYRHGMDAMQEMTAVVEEIKQRHLQGASSSLSNVSPDRAEEHLCVADTDAVACVSEQKAI